MIYFIIGGDWIRRNSGGNLIKYQIYGRMVAVHLNMCYYHGRSYGMIFPKASEVR
jgi:hypothetical protein